MSIDSKKISFAKLARYGFFGVASAGIEFLVFLLIESMVYIYVASVISFVAGLASSFIFNKFIVFNNSKKISKGEVVQFLLLGLINSQLSSLITLGISFVLPGSVAKLISMGAIAAWNFLLMNFVIFKRRND